MFSRGNGLIVVASPAIVISPLVSWSTTMLLYAFGAVQLFQTAYLWQCSLLPVRRLSVSMHPKQ